MLTETDAIAKYLDEADREWPELNGDRSALLKRLIEEGWSSVVERRGAAIDNRRAAIRAYAGRFSGIYPPGAAEALKNEWPD